jgi:hypothetical protein
MLTMLRLLPFAVALAALVSCAEREPSVAPPVATQPVAPASPVATPPTAVGDGWLGKWRGPEGTALLLSGSGGVYDIAITNLDGERTFRGTAHDNEIRFERDGVAEVIHAGNGADTGMKWLADKRDCLIVRSGEGYCRD